MSIETLLEGLNPHQLAAATLGNQHALVLAGAGSGKTNTIVARAGFLISQGTPAHRIKILTFTRRSASEIVERVKTHLGEQAALLSGSTFHAWCVSLMHRAPAAFGTKGLMCINREDQIQLFKVIRGSGKGKPDGFPTAATLCDSYSLARNTNRSLTDTLAEFYPDSLKHKELIATIMQGYEERKRARKYMDYDDLLDIIAQRIRESEQVRKWVCSQYDHILVDEMQDTNPLQWKLLDPLKDECVLFCVGDDAQSIYGFRGADFKNVHSFGERVPGAVVLKLQDNYRSTQEILDVSNWLLDSSLLEYGKRLVAARGAGQRPELHNFSNEWEEASWIASDIHCRRDAGDDWAHHMILARSGNAARHVEGALIAAEIPYRFIGGTKLMASAHVNDVLSALRIVGNPADEIALIRFLTLFPGVGDVTAAQAIKAILATDSLPAAIEVITANKKIPAAAAATLIEIMKCEGVVAEAIGTAVRMLKDVLTAKYRNLDWERRQQDFPLIQKIAEKHTSILAFIEEYLLDPVSVTQLTHDETRDVVTLITIHSAKGTECKTCYVINVSPGAYPSRFAAGNQDEVEEERRVLYVGLTRAMDMLIVTRREFSQWAVPAQAVVDGQMEDVETYFLNDIPDGLFDEVVHNRKPAMAAPYVAAPANGDWLELAACLPLAQSAKRLAVQCQLIGRSGEEIRLTIPTSHKRLLVEHDQEQIQAALCKLFGADMRLTIKIADAPGYALSVGINLD